MTQKTTVKRKYFNYAVAIAFATCNTNYSIASTTIDNITKSQINASSAGRYDFSENSVFLDNNKKLSITKMLDAYNYPKASKDYKFDLKKVVINGNTVFTAKDLITIYAKYLNKEITLDKVWYFAQKITELYQAQGYFLSRSYIPAQEIENGVVTINIVEGYIGQIDLQDDLKNNKLIKQLTSKLETTKPINTKTLENILLQMNDLKGTEYKAVLHRVDNMNLKNGAAKITITPAIKDYHAYMSVDNENSKFLGPHQFVASFSKNFFNIQKTRISTAFDLSFRKGKHIDIQHDIPVALNWKFNILASYDKNTPKSALSDYKIDSYAKKISPAIVYTAIRQQDKNLTFSLSLDAKNVETKINNNTILSKDKIRAIRAKADYTFLDMLNSFNMVEVSLDKGLTAFGASKKNNKNLSRSNAKPTFLKLQLNYSRQDNIANNFVSIAKLSTQLSSSSLFSSEQFSYGGKHYGQAYDPNEISGDNGAAASVELLYTKLKRYNNTSIYPYILYNIGQVRQKQKIIGEKNKQSAATAAFGIKFDSKNGFGGNLGIAMPLTKKVSAPIRGNGKTARLFFNISYKF